MAQELDQIIMFLHLKWCHLEDTVREWERIKLSERISGQLYKFLP